MELSRSVHGAESSTCWILPLIVVQGILNESLSMIRHNTSLFKILMFALIILTTMFVVVVVVVVFFFFFFFLGGGHVMG